MRSFSISSNRDRGFSIVGALGVLTLTGVAVAQGGDNPNTATPIGLNTPTNGTTNGFVDDSDEVCPYPGSTSPDVYYVYAPLSSHNLTVELCNSGYDTKTYVYDSSLQLVTTTNGGPACNDDACTDNQGNPFRSLLNCVPVQAGLQYFVVVDGFNGDAGPYNITLHETEAFLGDPQACDPGGGLGACCFPKTFDCQDGLDPIECKSQGGAYQGDGTLCSRVDCTPFLLDRPQAVSVVLDPGNGVKFDPLTSVMWCPFEDFGFGPGFEGLLPAGWRIETPEQNDPPILVDVPSYLFWIDDQPGASFAHPSRFVLVDATSPTGNIVEFVREWWPWIVSPLEEVFEYFRRTQDRVSDQPAAPDNQEGLVGGSTPGPDDVVDVEPSNSDPPPNNTWALIVRGAARTLATRTDPGEKAFINDVNLQRNDLKDHFKVPANNIRVAGDRTEQPATKQEFIDLIDDFCEDVDDCDKIYVRLGSHGNVNSFSFRDGSMNGAQMCTQLRKLAKKGVPICLHIQSCSSASLLNVHNWDFPAGSSITTSAESGESSYGYAFRAPDGTDFTNSILLHAIHTCLNADPKTEGLDDNGDGFVDECEAYDWAIDQNPCYTIPATGQVNKPNDPNPEKRVVGISARGMNVLVCNNTGAAKTGFKMKLRGNVTGVTPRAWRATAGDVIQGAWGTGNHTTSYDAEADETTICWQDTDDPVQPGQYIHFGYRKKGLKPLRQNWTPASAPGGSADSAPVAEASIRLNGTLDQLIVRTTSRSALEAGSDASVTADLYYRVAPEDVPIENLNLGDPLVADLAQVSLGRITLVPDDPATFTVEVPSEFDPAEYFILESHLSWGLSGNTTIQLKQYAPLACPGDLDANEEVGFQDLLILLASWSPGPNSCIGCAADLDGDGDVDFQDLLILLAIWGPC